MAEEKRSRVVRKRWIRQALVNAGLVSVVASILVLGMITALPAATVCPWKIHKVGVGKWGNGNKKSEVWLDGSFPSNIPGTTERPAFYINGVGVGKSSVQQSMRLIPYASSLLDSGDNTVTVKFTKSYYDGASYTCTITGFNWDHVPNGGYKWYMCR